MNNKTRSTVLALAILGLAALFVTGVDIFISGHEKELAKDEVKNEFYETDTALRTKEACDKKKDVEACLKTGIYYLDGKIIQVNREKAAKYLLKACDLKSAVGCYQLGKFWQADKEEETLNRKAKLYYNRACDYGDADACRIIKKK